MQVYKWAQSFVNCRCFGWGIGTYALVPVADMFNSTAVSPTTFTLFQKKLHLAEDNAYLYEKNFDKLYSDDSLSLEEKLYLFGTSKARWNVTKLFENDKEVQGNAAK